MAWAAYNYRVKAGTATGKMPPPMSDLIDPPIMARPLYYGSLMFTMAAKGAARMLRATTHTNCEQHNGMEGDRSETSHYIVAHVFRSKVRVFVGAREPARACPCV